jgi:hypothetical protein
MMMLKLVIAAVSILVLIVLIWGFWFFEEFEIGVEFLPKGYNSFELGISNRNYYLDNGGLEQELRIGLLLINVIFLFRRFDA